MGDGICPYCGAEAETVAEEIAHMQEAHPDIIEARLREAGDIGPGEAYCVGCQRVHRVPVARSLGEDCPLVLQ